MSLLSVNNLSVHYASEAGTVDAVRGASFELSAGEVLGIAGESGSGKSTLAKAIMRILQPPGFIGSGEILLDGSDILKMSRDELREIRWARISMVFQSALDSLNPVTTITAQFQDLALARQGRMFTAPELKALLELVNLPDRTLDAYPHQLSGGMRQRVGIALALALKPELVILDEPTTALDVIVQRDILRGLRSLQAEHGFSVLFITHDLPVLLAMSDRVIIMKDGSICEIGTPSELMNAPQHGYTRTLMAASGLGVEVGS